jgi:hypothetical protein
VFPACQVGGYIRVTPGLKPGRRMTGLRCEQSRLPLLVVADLADLAAALLPARPPPVSPAHDRAIGAETICAAVHVMSQLYDLAMKETSPIVLANPFSSLELPVIRPREIDFLERSEADALYAAGEIGALAHLDPARYLGRAAAGGASRAAWPPGGLASRQGPGQAASVVRRHGSSPGGTILVFRFLGDTSAWRPIPRPASARCGGRSPTG